MPENDRILIRNVIARIRDISNTLLKKAKQDLVFSDTEKREPKMLYSLLNQIVDEKQMQYGIKINLHFQFDKQAYQIFSLINSSEFSRIISNLINNSVDAIESDNRILVSLYDLEEESLIEIKDHGKGISSHALDKLGQLGNSFGKNHGTGIGLNHAINKIKDWSGRLEIESQEGNGVTVKIYLPKCKYPSWFAPDVLIKSGQYVAIIDDDESIHAIWKMRFKQFCMETGVAINLQHFYKPEDLIEWQKRERPSQNILYLCDHEFLESQTKGLELIKELQISSLSILVTSNTDPAVISQCEIDKIKLMPKDIASIITIAEISRNHCS
jgi:hypothetical protein